jgi:hypothetical protein
MDRKKQLFVLFSFSSPHWSFLADAIYHSDDAAKKHADKVKKAQKVERKA